MPTEGDNILLNFEVALEKSKANNLYIGFLDLLGFSSSVRTDFDSAIETYKYILAEAMGTAGILTDVSIRTYSDAFLLTSQDLLPVVQASCFLQMSALRNGHHIRGGVGFGKHIEITDASNLFVVSAALVRAVEIEKTVKYPCVEIAPEIVIPPEYWRAYAARNFDRYILHYEGKNIVNPCNPYWGLSARMRTEKMLQEKPQYAEKFRWFLRLVDAIQKSEPLIPQLDLGEKD
jgi:hypothetical protein